jgi:hypothetical protein
MPDGGASRRYEREGYEERIEKIMQTDAEKQLCAEAEAAYHNSLESHAIDLLPTMLSREVGRLTWQKLWLAKKLAQAELEIAATRNAYK